MEKNQVNNSQVNINESAQKAVPQQSEPKNLFEDMGNHEMDTKSFEKMKQAYGLADKK